MKTLYKRRQDFYNNFDVPKNFQEIIENQDKKFIKELIEISKENNWEVAIDDGYKDGFRIISGEEWIKNKSGFEE